MHSNKHSDYITHINNEEDRDYLNRELFDVNMRLFKTSIEYRAIVHNCCKYIADLCRTKMDGYKKPHGMSGANAAIPFNIIAYTKNRNQIGEFVEIMINPEIIEVSEDSLIHSKSNCGSLTLEEPIEIERYERVKIKYFNIFGERFEGTFYRESGGLTIQHEIDHNNGILITDRVLVKACAK